MSYQRIKIDQYGDPLSVLALEQVNEIPLPSDDEIVIQLIASPIHPSDLMFAAGQYFAYGTTKPIPPTYPGSEGMVRIKNESTDNMLGVGRIHLIGKNIKEFTVGQRVAFYSAINAWSEYLVLKKPFTSIIPVPEALPDTVAGQTFVNPLTAYGMLVEINAKHDEWILQTASGSVLGQVTIQLAKARRLQLINIVRRAEQIEELKSKYGSDIHVLAFDGTNEAEVIRQIENITNGKGVKYLLDSVGSSTAELGLKVLAVHGRALFYGLMSGVSDIKINYADVLMQGILIEGFRITPWLLRQTPEETVKIFTDLIGLLATKQISPVLEEVFTLSNFKEAVIKSVTPGKFGKVFLAPHPEQLSRH